MTSMSQLVSHHENGTVRLQPSPQAHSSVRPGILRTHLIKEYQGVLCQEVEDVADASDVA